MAKKDHAEALWNEELGKGWEPAMKSRLAFHGGLHVRPVAGDTGRSIQTVRRWFSKLVEGGFAVYADETKEHIRPANATNS